jgi:hypothetical protein
MLRHFESSPWRRLTACAVLILIAGLGFVESVHLHEDLAPSGAARSHCALCVLSHSPAAITAARSAPVPVLDYVSLQSAEPQLRSRLLVRSLSIRPPPSL